MHSIMLCAKKCFKKKQTKESKGRVVNMARARWSPKG